MTIQTRSRASLNRAAGSDTHPKLKRRGLTATTFNVNGIHGKAAHLSSILVEGPQLHRLPPTSISLLQELKTDSPSLEDDPSLGSFRTTTRVTYSLWCPGRSTHTAGVAILLHNLPSASILHSWVDTDHHLPLVGPGHLARLDTQLEGTHYTIINVYMPQAIPLQSDSRLTHQTVFLQYTMPKCLSSYRTGKLIMGGDWNMVLNPEKDCYAATRPTTPPLCSGLHRRPFATS